MAGWEELLPGLGALGGSELTGELALPELEVRGAPLDVRGTLELVDLVVEAPDREPAAVAGEVILLGDALQSRDLVVSAAGQPVELELRVDALFAEPRFQIDLETNGAEMDALLRAFAGQPDRLYGPLVGGGRLGGSLAAGTDLLQSLGGDLQLGIEGGRIPGLSLLEAALGPLGARLAELGRGQSSQLGGDVERFYGEDFESLSAALRFEGGRLLARPLNLVYRGYEVELAGEITLEDLALDLEGRLTVYEELDAELARGFGAPEAYAPRRRSLPLAAVRGELGAPEVQLSRNSVAQLALAYGSESQREELRQKAEERLGEGGGAIVDEGLRVLEGLFGGGGGAAKGDAGEPEGGGAPEATGPTE